MYGSKKYYLSKYLIKINYLGFYEKVWINYMLEWNKKNLKEKSLGYWQKLDNLMKESP